MPLALIADTHGRLPDTLLRRLGGSERILHLGDLGPSRLLLELEGLAPTLAVGGNVDPSGHSELPPERRLSVAGLPLHLRHHPWSEAEIDPAAEAVYLHGHTHVPRLARLGRALLICPGAVHGPRDGHPAAMGLLEIGPELVHCVLVALADGRVLAQGAWPRA